MSTSDIGAACFPFAVDTKVARWNRLFGVNPDRASVTVDDGGLCVRFGRWTLVTARHNVAEVHVTGPYRWWKVAGPAHLSLADRGVTFATSTGPGVCVHFRTPVPAIDPLHLVRHPAMTVTVADVEAFVAALSPR